MTHTASFMFEFTAFSEMPLNGPVCELRANKDLQIGFKESNCSLVFSTGESLSDVFH